MANFCKLTHEPLDLNAISKMVVETTTGGLAIFAGTTRDYFQVRL